MHVELSIDVARWLLRAFDRMEVCPAEAREAREAYEAVKKGLWYEEVTFPKGSF